MSSIVKVDHSLVRHLLTKVRDKTTPAAEFRDSARRLSTLLAYEATKDLPVEAIEIVTPVSATTGYRLSQRVSLVPILRAGLGMVDAVLDLIPDAEVWHLGFYRDESTLSPVEYYKKLPSRNPPDVAIVLDPMLATGGSAVAAIDAIDQWGVPTVKLLALIAAPQGIERVHMEFPRTQIVVAAVDSHLNEHGFIVPGLGDAGDRIFNAVAN